MKRTMVVADEGEEERVQTNMAAIAEGEERQQQKRRSREIVEEDVGDCKRPRTERICTVMTTIEEEVCGTRLRLFKWNESLFDDHFSGYGIIMIRVYNNFNNGSSSPDGTFVEQLVSLFDLTKLRNGDSMKSVAMMALADTNAFADRTTIEALAEEISTYLSSNFRFTKRTLSCPRTRRIVVLVEVDMITTTEYRLIEDDETIMAIHQGCGNNGDSYLQGENHNQYDEQCFVIFDIQLEDDSMESVTEEAGVDHDYEVGYGESETGDQEEEEQEEEEHEEAGVDHDYEVGFMESETGDQEEEEEEEEIQAEDDMEEVSSGVASDPELMEIEYTIWRFLGDLPMFNRGDREFSRDAKGLKKVESAIEIITEFRDYGNDSKEVDSCPCCLEGFVVEGKAVAKTRCSHLFHRDCLCLWLSRKDSCPLCRSKCATYV